MCEAFLKTQHRPFPLPTKPWLMTQTWNHLLFCHWPVSYAFIRSHVPTALQIDTFHQTCWLSIIVFQVKPIRIRWIPPIPFIDSFYEVNVRTYVTFNGIPGVYFFKLDVNNWPAVIGGKIGAFLPFRKANIQMNQKRNTIFFENKPAADGWTSGKLKLQYQPNPLAFTAKPGSLEHWLCERYCLFTVKGRQIYRGDMHHTHWKLRQADVLLDTMPNFIHEKTIGPPLFHYAQKKQAFIWPWTKMSLAE